MPITNSVPGHCGQSAAAQASHSLKGGAGLPRAKDTQVNAASTGWDPKGAGNMWTPPEKCDLISGPIGGGPAQEEWCSPVGYMRRRLQRGTMVAVLPALAKVTQLSPSKHVSGAPQITVCPSRAQDECSPASECVFSRCPTFCLTRKDGQNPC